MDLQKLVEKCVNDCVSNWIQGSQGNGWGSKFPNGYPWSEIPQHVAMVLNNFGARMGWEKADIERLYGLAMDHYNARWLPLMPELGGVFGN